MTITWLGHSSFRLEESTGAVVVTDPYDAKVVGYEMPKVKADIVTVSHSHNDHDALDRIEGEPIVLDSIGAFEIDGVHIASLRSYHDRKQGAKRGENRVFTIGMDGVDICHLGDIGEECQISFVEALGSVNVLLIPVGGNYTIDAEEAKNYVDLIMPDIVIPMHYKTRDSDMDIDRLDDFLRLFDDEAIVYAGSNTIEFDRRFDSDSTKVIVLEK